MGPPQKLLVIPPNLNGIFNRAYKKAKEGGLVRRLLIDSEEKEFALIDYKKLRRKLDSDSIETIKNEGDHLGIFLGGIKKSFVFTNRVPEEFQEAIGVHECGEAIVYKIDTNLKTTKAHGYACKFDLEYALNRGEDFFEAYAQYILKHPGYFRAIPHILKIAKRKKLSQKETLELYRKQLKSHMHVLEIKEKNQFVILNEEEKFEIYLTNGKKIATTDNYKNSIFEIYEDLLNQKKYADAKALRKILREKLQEDWFGQKRDPTEKYTDEHITALIAEEKYEEVFEIIKEFRLGKQIKRKFNEIHTRLLNEENFGQAKKMEEELPKKYLPYTDVHKRNYVEWCSNRIFKYEESTHGHYPCYIPDISVLESLEKFKSVYGSDVVDVVKSELSHIKWIFERDIHGGDLNKREFKKRLRKLLGK